MDFEKIYLYKLLHKKDASYGSSSIEYLPEILSMIEHLKPETILDYGCGKGAVDKAIQEYCPDIKIFGYDPAIEGKEVLPIEKADLVINTDVLEHIPEKELPIVLEDIRKISEKVYFHLHHAKAICILPNGENAHCTVKPPTWYHELLSRYFDIVNPLEGRADFLSVVCTFDLPDDVKNRYMKIVEENKK